ncbi:MAG TPA: 2-oxo-4-hydroxy-4-carboxy-5-ureidoimidazoline decarboxylase [Jatrophihabitans sp.]|jgi:2-oxo-4-hydroxy-4-carboxy-5-ureidoimidazoline decarboxylase
MTTTNKSAPPQGIGLQRFNRLPADDAVSALLACCSSPDWATAIATGRPYGSHAQLYDRARQVLAGLSESEIDAALYSHPRIGDRPTEPAAAWSRSEQAGVAADIRHALAEANRGYEERFGHVYLVCATGRSGPELLAILNERMSNDPATERGVLRAELGKINTLRLTKLLEGPAT